MVLYFGVGTLFLFACKRLERVKLLHKIELKPVEKKQTTFEIASCSDRFYRAIAKYLAEYNARNCATHTLE